MKKTLLLLTAFLGIQLTVRAGDPPHSDSKQFKEPVVPVEKDHWKFMLGSPGWLAGVEGTVGIDGINSDIDVGFKNLVNKIDMVMALRGEASKGRFGIMGELFYLSMSDSLGVGGPVRKVDVRGDEYLADMTLRWRLLEGERGFVDLLAGVRYTNLYQHLHLQGDNDGITQSSENFVDRISEAIRDRLNGVLTEGRFRNALTTAVRDSVGSRLNGAVGANPRRQNLPIGPIAGRQPDRIGLLVEQTIRAAEASLRAEINALGLGGAARAAEVQRRVDAAKSQLEKKVADILKKNLNSSFSRCDDWWDPYVGLRARFNFTRAIYVIGRGDIGGFGVGSDLMWQAEGALGFQLTRSIYTELGYRALSFDYHKNGLTFDTITHGAQVTVGLLF